MEAEASVDVTCPGARLELGSVSSWDCGHPHWAVTLGVHLSCLCLPLPLPTGRVPRTAPREGPRHGGPAVAPCSHRWQTCWLQAPCLRPHLSRGRHRAPVCLRAEHGLSVGTWAGWPPGGRGGSAQTHACAHLSLASWPRPACSRGDPPHCSRRRGWLGGQVSTHR